MPRYNWKNTESVGNKSYTCGYCNNDVGLSEWYFSPYIKGVSERANIYICPNCKRPSFFEAINTQTPHPLLGRPVAKIPNKDIQSLYHEARACTSVGAYTAAVMSCRM